jgi:hypothetical protein
MAEQCVKAIAAGTMEAAVLNNLMRAKRPNGIA